MNNFSMDNTYFSINKALEFVGDNSKFQKQVINVLAIKWMLFSFFVMGMPFLFQQPQFTCRFSEESESYTKCSQIQACNDAFEVQIDEKASPKSITKDFKLYCDRQYLVGMCGSIYFVGATISGFIFPQISDRKGRKYSIIASMFLSSISIILSGFSQNIYQFMVIIFFIGVGLNGFETVSLVYVSEISAEKFRNYSTITLNCAWAIAQILFSFLSLYFNNWRHICIILIGIPSLILVFISNKVLLETPRYLASKNQHEEARNILNLICIKNGRPRFQYRLEGEIQEQVDFKSKIHQQNLQVNNYNYIDLFRYPSLRKITLSMIVFWTFKYVIYFGQSFSLSSLGGEMHSNLTFMAISEVVATLLSAPIKMKLRRISSLFWFSICTSIACISLIFLQMPSQCYFVGQTCIQKALSMIFAMTIKFGISIYGNILITYTSEKYPTVVRSIGYGISITSGKIFTIFVPLIVVWVQYYGFNPLAFFGFIGILAATLTMFMEETKGEQMKDQIEENLENEDALIELSNIGGISNKIMKQNLLK